MRARWIFLTIAVVALLAIGIGFAVAGTSTTPAMTTAGCTQMHNTAGMRQMHAQMPAAAQAECDQLHARTGTTMGGQMGAGMMGSGGMMSDSMTGHHANGMMGR